MVLDALAFQAGLAAWSWTGLRGCRLLGLAILIET